MNPYLATEHGRFAVLQCTPATLTMLCTGKTIVAAHPLPSDTGIVRFFADKQFLVLVLESVEFEAVLAGQPIPALPPPVIARRESEPLQVDININTKAATEYLTRELERMVESGLVRMEFCGHEEHGGNLRGFTLDKTKYRLRLADETETSVRVLLERVSPYKEFRSDGWPICPVCEEDELYSVVMMGWLGKGEKPTLEQCIAGPMRCYRCNWSSEKLRR